MKMLTVLFFSFSALLFLGTGHFLLAVKRPGVYPPKQVLKNKAGMMAGGGGICLLIALMFSYFS